MGEEARLAEYLLSLYGGDPFGHVREASESHRIEHAASLAGGEQECGLFPAGPARMRIMAGLVRATGPRRIMEIGCGYGYSALWLAEAAGTGARVDTIDRFPEHLLAAERFAKAAGLRERIDFHTGEASDVLLRLPGHYDFVHDDGWFAEQPAYFERMLDLTRPGGVVAMSNWFLLEQSLLKAPDTDWSVYGGKDWRGKVQEYARRLAADPRLHVSWIAEPALALAIRIT